jgi:hypothetical protein
LAASSPFHFNVETETIPIALAAINDFQEAFGQTGEMVGFVSFDGTGGLWEILSVAPIHRPYRILRSLSLLMP